MNCNFQLVGNSTGGNEFRCAACNRKLYHPTQADPTRIHRRCLDEFIPDNETTEQRATRPKRTLRLAWSATVAHARWVAAGMPVRSAEEIKTTFEICKACKFFDMLPADQGTCKVCGCGLKKAGGLGAKNMMATEHCPLTPPKW